MKRFELFVYDKETERLEENKILDWLKEKFSKVKSLLLNLKFGSTQIVSMSRGNVNEEYLTEAGDWHATVMGIFSEKWATWSLVNEMDKAGFHIKNDPAAVKSVAVKYGKQIKDSIDTGYSVFSGDKKKLSVTSINTVTKEYDNYKAKGILLGKRIFVEQFAPVADSRYCEYEVLHSGGSDAKLSTADLKIQKFSKSKMQEEYKYSLKTYISSGEGTKGTEKDAFGLLGLAIGIDSMTVRTFHKHVDKFEQAFGKDFSPMAEKSIEIVDFINERKQDLKSKGLKKVGGLQIADAVKLEAAQLFGSEIIDLQAHYWQQMIAVGLKKKEREVKKALLQLLDLDNNSSALVTAGMEKSGQLVTWERSSPELDKIMSTPVDKIDIRIDAPEKPLTRRWTVSGMDKAIGKKTKKGSNLMVVISIDGIELYRVTSQLKIGGRVQFSSRAYHRKTSVDLDIDINQILETQSSKAKSLIRQEVKSPGSTPRLLPTNRRPSAKAMRGAYTRVENYAEKYGLNRLSKKQKMDAADLVARGMTVEDVMALYH